MPDLQPQHSCIPTAIKPSYSFHLSISANCFKYNEHRSGLDKVRGDETGIAQIFHDNNLYFVQVDPDAVGRGKWMYTKYLHQVSHREHILVQLALLKNK